MKSLASESISNAYFNSKRLSRSFPLAQPGISTLGRLWDGFDSDTELFMGRTLRINHYNKFCKKFNEESFFKKI